MSVWLGALLGPAPGMSAPGPPDTPASGMAGDGGADVPDAAANGIPVAVGGASDGMTRALAAWQVALERNDPAAAYALLAFDARGGMNEEQFRAFFEGHRAWLREELERWKAVAATEEDTRVSVDGREVQLVRSDGTWKILDPSPLHGPRGLTAAIRAVAAGLEQWAQVVGGLPIDPQRRELAARQWRQRAEWLRASAAEASADGLTWGAPVEGWGVVSFGRVDGGGWELVDMPAIDVGVDAGGAAEGSPAPALREGYR